MEQLATSSPPATHGSPGRSIKVFLVDGTPNGVIIGTVGNWVGTVLAAPRARLPDLLRRPEAGRTGIYILVGPDQDRPGGTKAYIGEADSVANRLRIHLNSDDKDFFERLVIIVSTDDALTKAHVRFLGQLIRLVREAGSVTLANTTQPDFQLLPEADKADMAFFLGQLRLVLPILGFDLFRRSSGAGSSSGPLAEGAVFTFATAGVSAIARETDDGFVVLANSTARRNGTETFPEGYRILRDQLLKDGHLTVGNDPETLRFATDVAFASPSAAASVVAARSASGPREWKIQGTGQLYRDWRAAKLGEG